MEAGPKCYETNKTQEWLCSIGTMYHQEHSVRILTGVVSSQMHWSEDST